MAKAAKSKPAKAGTKARAAGRPRAGAAQLAAIETGSSSAPPSLPAAPSPRRRGAVLVRVQRAIEQELAKIETIIAGDVMGEDMAAKRTEAERTARTLATLARTLKEIARLREAKRKVKKQHDDMPRDLDQFRRELARRLDALVAQSAPDNPE